MLGHRQIDAAAIVGVDPKTWMGWSGTSVSPRSTSIRQSSDILDMSREFDGRGRRPKSDYPSRTRPSVRKAGMRSATLSMTRSAPAARSAA